VPRCNPETIPSRDLELALLGLHEEGVLKEVLQDGLDVVNVMFLLGLGEDQYIIQVNKIEPIKRVSEHVIHQGLENSGGTG